MDHMLTAIGPGVAVAELVWQRGRLRDIVRVPGHRLMQDPFVSPAVRIETDDEPVDGAPTYSPGYLVHCPNDRAGFPIRVTLTRATAWLWLIKHYGVSDWSTFAETYGHPWRIANFTRAAQDGEVDAVEAMLRDMTSDMYGVFTDAVDVKFLEAARNNQPFEGLVDWCERKQSILWLGQTLTTEQGSVGSLALGQVHDNTRASITLADIHAEAAMYREQLLTPMVRFRFPGENLPVPQFVRQVAEDAQVEVQRLRMDQIKLWKELYPDEPLDRDWVAEQLQVRRQSQESPL